MNISGSMSNQTFPTISNQEESSENLFGNWLHITVCQFDVYGKHSIPDYDSRTLQNEVSFLFVNH